jgi:hypothetical protein
MNALAGALVGALTLEAGIAAGQTRGDGRPNIIFIMTGDHAAQDWRVVATAAAALGCQKARMSRTTTSQPVSFRISWNAPSRGTNRARPLGAAAAKSRAPVQSMI